MGDFIIRTDYGTEIKTYNHGQSRILNAADHNDVVIVLGPAGTGKTFVSVALALREIQDGSTDSLMLTRPAVQAGEDLGFLPGELSEKLQPYMAPFYSALRKVLDQANYHNYHENGVISYEPLGFLRGQTINGCVVLDEAQNATQDQLEMLLTRLGKKGSAFITGDPSQTDLPGHVTGALDRVGAILGHIHGIKIVELSEEDIVRHRIVRDVILAYREERKTPDPPKSKSRVNKLNNYDQETDQFAQRLGSGLKQDAQHYENGQSSSKMQ